MTESLYDSEYLVFSFVQKSVSGKTNVYDVDSKSGNKLGYIRWHGPWRCYVFHPENNVLFNCSCLTDISEFCWEETQAHKEKAK